MGVINIACEMCGTRRNTIRVVNDEEGYTTELCTNCQSFSYHEYSVLAE